MLLAVSSPENTTAPLSVRRRLHVLARVALGDRVDQDAECHDFVGDGMVVRIAKLDLDRSRGERRVLLLEVLRRLEHAGHPVGLPGVRVGVPLFDGRVPLGKVAVVRESAGRSGAAASRWAPRGCPPSPGRSARRQHRGAAFVARRRASPETHSAAIAPSQPTERRRSGRRIALFRRLRHRRAALLAERGVGLVRRRAAGARHALADALAEPASSAAAIGRTQCPSRAGIRGRSRSASARAGATLRSISRISALASSRYCIARAS